jgi:hypothetical protein
LETFNLATISSCGGFVDHTMAGLGVATIRHRSGQYLQRNRRATSAWRRWTFHLVSWFFIP